MSRNSSDKAEYLRKNWYCILFGALVGANILCLIEFLLHLNITLPFGIDGIVLMGLSGALLGALIAFIVLNVAYVSHDTIVEPRDVVKEMNAEVIAVISRF